MRTPNAIVVLAGGIKQDALGRWGSTDLSAEDDKLGAPGGKLRVLATAVLATEYPATTVVASGGVGYDVPKDAPDGRPLLCEILCNELIEVGVPKEHIDLENKSNTTYQQLQQLTAFIKKYDGNKTMVISNRWHLPRIEAILEVKFPVLKKLVELVSAEDVLIESDQIRWKPMIDKEYSSAYLMARIDREKQGIEQIKKGTYKFMKTDLTLRHATMDDAKTLFEWKNDADTRVYSINHNAVTLDEHVMWLSQSLKNKDRILCIAELSGSPVGVVRADRSEGDSFEISYTVAPLYRGKGFGGKMVMQFTKEMLSGRPITAKIRKGHVPSENIARAIGLNPTNHGKNLLRNESDNQSIIEWW